MDYAVGIDLGGTRVKAVAVAADGTILDRRAAATDEGGREAWAADVVLLVEELEARRGERATWLAIASPGLPARDGRSMADVSGPLAGLRGLDWTELLERSRLVPVLNDAHAALVGEAWRGAAAGCRDALLVTLGTGVGGAVLTGGRLLRGHLGRGGHVGHISVDADGPCGTTGIPGALEDAIGDRTVRERSGGRFSSTEELVERHLAGDGEASRVWLRSVYLLACAVASLVNVLDPEVVIVGGGIAKAGPALFEPLAGHLARVEWRVDGEGVRVVPAALGDMAGALGAARFAMDPASLVGAEGTALAPPL